MLEQQSVTSFLLPLLFFYFFYSFVLFCFLFVNVYINLEIVQDVIDESNIARLVYLLDSFDSGLKKASVTAVACIAEGNGMTKIQTITNKQFNKQTIKQTIKKTIKQTKLTFLFFLLVFVEKNQQILHKHRADKIVSQIVMLEREPNSLVAAGAHAIASLCRGNGMLSPSLSPLPSLSTPFPPSPPPSLPLPLYHYFF